jgi:hypothetical protein
MPFRSRLRRIHIIVSVPVSPAQCGNGRARILNRLPPSRFSIKAISFELKEPALVTPDAVTQLHP